MMTMLNEAMTRHWGKHDGHHAVGIDGFDADTEVVPKVSFRPDAHRHYQRLPTEGAECNRYAGLSRQLQGCRIRQRKRVDRQAAIRRLCDPWPPSLGHKHCPSQYHEHGQE